MEAQEKTIRSLFRDNIVLLCIVLFAYVSNAVFNLIMSNMLEPMDYGDISVVLQLLVFLAPFALLGTELSIVKYFPKYLAQNEYGKMHGFIRWSYEVIFGIAFFIFLVSSFVVFVSMIVSSKGTAFERWHIAVYSIWLVPIYAINNMLALVLQSLKKYYHSAVFNGITSIGITLLINILLFVFWQVFAGSWFGRDQLRFTVVFIIAFGFTISALYQLQLCKRFLPQEVWDTEPVRDQDEWRDTSWKMLISTAIFAGLMSIDIVLIELLSFNEKDVAFFAAISVICGSIYLFGTAIDMIVNPQIALLIERNDIQKLQSLLNKMNLFKVIPAACFLVGILLFGKDILHFFGKSFSGATLSLDILAISFFIGLCFNSAGALLVYTKYQILNFWLSVAQIIYIFLGDVIFIPFFGLPGAIGVLGSSIILSVFIRTFFVRKYLNIRSFYIL